MYRGATLGKLNAAGAAGGAATGATAGMALGPIGAVVGGVIGGAAGAFSGGSAPSGPGKKAIDEMLRQQKLDAQAADAMSRIQAAGTESGKVIKYALFGTGGLLLAGALTLWILSRKKKAG